MRCILNSDFDSDFDFEVIGYGTFNGRFTIFVSRDGPAINGLLKTGCDIRFRKCIFLNIRGPIHRSPQVPGRTAVE